jgi:hypothetical protein
MPLPQMAQMTQINREEEFEHEVLDNHDLCHL